MFRVNFFSGNVVDTKKFDNVLDALCFFEKVSSKIKEYASFEDVFTPNSLVCIRGINEGLPFELSLCD